MNAKPILFFSCFATVMLAASVAMAGPHGGGGNHFMSMPARGGRPFVANGMGRFSGQHWNGGNWGGNWHHHNHGDFNNNVTFIGGFGGFPFWGFPFWGWGYPYGYYASYPYGYYGSGYYGGGYYGSGYYGGGYYGGTGYRYGYRHPRTYYGRQGHSYVGYGHRSSRIYYGRPIH